MLLRGLAPVGVVLLGACGGAPPPPLLANRVEEPPRPVCSQSMAADLASRLGTRWDADGRHFELRCTGGRFPEVGYFVEVRWTAVRRIGVVALDGEREIIPFVDRDADRADRPVMPQLYAVDLDDNGIDEVLDAWRHEQHGISGDRLILWTTNGTQIERVDGPHLSAFRSGLGSCHTSVEAGAGYGVAVTVWTSQGLSPTDCLPDGRHRFVMRAGKLEQVQSTRERSTVRAAPSTAWTIVDRVRS